MTKDDILLALRLTAMGRAGHPLQEELAEKLARVFLMNACDVCTMPGGKHYEHCPNNPEHPDKVVLPEAGVLEFDVRDITLADIPDGSVSPAATPLMDTAKRRGRPPKKAE